MLGANELTVGGNNMSTEVSGVISGLLGSLVKVGTGTLTLSGTNTYIGPTTVNAGTLAVNGSIASSSLTTVNVGGALGGNGTVGDTVINAGGFLVPGPVGAPGTMTVERQSGVPVGRVLCRAGQSYGGGKHQRERHRLACRHGGGRLRCRAPFSSAATPF